MAPYFMHIMIAFLFVVIYGWMSIPSKWVRDLEEALEEERKK
jgi:hypothetical protein